MIKKNTAPLVWITVLHWRGKNLTRECLESLRNIEYPNYKVLLVDNGSQDDEAELLGGYDNELFSGEEQRVELLRLPENKGFSGGCNEGLTYCLERGAEFVWLVNNDATVFSDTLDRLIECAMANERSGAIGASLTNIAVDGGEPEIYGPGFIDYVNCKTDLSTPVDDKVIECDWLSGSNLLLRAQALREIGCFNDDYFLYFEDVELCARLTSGGWTCLVEPRARVRHHQGSSTFGSKQIWRYYYYARNRLLFFTGNVKMGVKFWRVARIILIHLRGCLLLPVSGKNGLLKFRGECLALRDFLSGLKGKARHL